MQDSVEAFNPQRLLVARQRRGLTKSALADAAGLTLRSISAYETGETIPSQESLGVLARCLLFPMDFFFGSDLDVPSVDGVSFRSLKALTASKRDTALAAAAFAFLFSDWIDAQFNVPSPSIPELRESSPEVTAEALRSLWGLGASPIANTVHLLEAKGARVFSLAEETRDLDAFSMWRLGRPFVFLNIGKSAERSRFDAMHELGHLCMHRHGGPAGRDAEHEADAFASAMLMPRASVLARAPKFVSLPVILDLKREWNVSAPALTRRLHDVRIISDWQYRTLFKQLSRAGLRRSEQNSCPHETSQVIPKIQAFLRKRDRRLADIAAELNIPAHELQALAFAPSFAAINGGGGTGPRSKKKSDLRLV